jgi:hypothetical protein
VSRTIEEKWEPFDKQGNVLVFRLPCKFGAEIRLWPEKYGLWTTQTVLGGRWGGGKCIHQSNKHLPLPMAKQYGIESARKAIGQVTRQLSGLLSDMHDIRERTCTSEDREI